MKARLRRYRHEKHFRRAALAGVLILASNAWLFGAAQDSVDRPFGAGYGRIAGTILRRR